MGLEQEGVKYRISLEDFFTKGISEADNSARKFESTISSLKGQIAGVFAGYQGFSFAKSIVDVGSQFESAEIGLGTLLKSAEQAHQVFEQVKKDAQSTPFDVQSLLLANKAMISAGVDAKTARTDVLNLANAIAATGGGNDELQRMVVNMQQIKNTGKATALDIKQFAYAGINIYGLLADATGKTTEQVKDMEVSYETLTNALMKAHEAGGIYEGGLEKMQNTTAVQLSNLGDAWNNFKNEIFLDQKESIKGMIKAVSDAISFVRDHFNTIKNLAIAIAGAAVAYKTLGIAVGIYRTYLVAQAAVTTELTVAQWALNGAMSANPIAVMALAVGGLIMLYRELNAELETSETILKKSTLNKTEEKNWIEEEVSWLKKKTDEIDKQNASYGKTASAFEAINQAKKILDNQEREENVRFQKMAYDASTYEKTLVEHKRKLAAIDVQRRFLGQNNAIDEILKASTSKGVGDLGSNLSEPKASKIQNITINVKDAFSNFKVQTSTLGMAMEEIRPKFAEFLISLVEDAAIVASE